MSGYPNHPPQASNNVSAPDQQYPPYSEVEWISSTPQQAAHLSHRAVVGGYESNGTPLWVIRARYERDLLPGKLALDEQKAYVPWGGYEHGVRDIEVCCTRRRHNIRWEPSGDGLIPRNAIVGGHTSSGEQLYVGRAREQGSMTPGKIQPSERVLYISYHGREIKHSFYEVMCYDYNNSNL